MYSYNMLNNYFLLIDFSLIVRRRFFNLHSKGHNTSITRSFMFKNQAYSAAGVVSSVRCCVTDETQICTEPSRDRTIRRKTRWRKRRSRRKSCPVHLSIVVAANCDIVSRVQRLRRDGDGADRVQPRT